jgi:hypothetical protein
VSEPDDRGLGELERQLQAAFAGTRPRRGFEDELRSRLRRRRWSGWLTPLLPAAAGAAAVVVAVVLLVNLASQAQLGRSTASSGPSASAPAATGTPPPLGALPRPGPDVQAGARAADGNAGATGRAAAPAPAPAEPQSNLARVNLALTPPPQVATVRVYAFGPGGSPGAVIDPSAIPSGLPSREYPARSSDEVLQAARAAASREATNQVTLTGWRLVYVAVPADPRGGYYEPAYEFTGTAGGGALSEPVSVLVLAVADPALR